MRQHLKHHRAVNTFLLLCDSIFLCDMNVPGRYECPSQAGFEIQTDDYCVICKILLMLASVGFDNPFSVLACSHTHSHTYTRFILCFVPNWPPFTDTSFHYTTKPTVNSVTHYGEQISNLKKKRIFWWTMCKKHNCDVFHFCTYFKAKELDCSTDGRWKLLDEHKNVNTWAGTEQCLTTGEHINRLSKGSTTGHTLDGHQVLIAF